MRDLLSPRQDLGLTRSRVAHPSQVRDGPAIAEARLTNIPTHETFSWSRRFEQVLRILSPWVLVKPDNGSDSFECCPATMVDSERAPGRGSPSFPNTRPQNDSRIQPFLDMNVYQMHPRKQCRCNIPRICSPRRKKYNYVTKPENMSRGVSLFLVFYSSF